MNKNNNFFFLLIIVAFLRIFLITFFKGEQENKGEDTSGTKTNTETIPAPPETNNEPLGLKLMKSSDCFTCHQQDVAVVGPSFKMIKRNTLSRMQMSMIYRTR